jgi:hypothetical protein
MRLPQMPDVWQVEDPTNDTGFVMPAIDESDDWGLDNPNSISGIIASLGLAPMPAGTSLDLLMDPHEIASVPDLPDHVLRSLGVNADGPAQGDEKQAPSAMASSPVSMASASESAAVNGDSNPVGQQEPWYAKPKGAVIYGTDAVNSGRTQALEKQAEGYSQDAAKRAGFAGEVRTVPPNYADVALHGARWAGLGLGALDIGDDTSKWLRGDSSNGKYALDLASTIAPALIGGLPLEAGALVYKGVDKLYPGGWAGLAGDSGSAYKKYVIDNPYYDPRLTAIP